MNFWRRLWCRQILNGFDKLKEDSRIPTSLIVCLRNLTLQFQNLCLENFAKVPLKVMSMDSFLLWGLISKSLQGEWRTDPSKNVVPYSLSSCISWAYWSYPRGITTDSKCPHRVQRVVFRTSFPNTRNCWYSDLGPLLKGNSFLAFAHPIHLCEVEITISNGNLDGVLDSRGTYDAIPQILEE